MQVAIRDLPPFPFELPELRSQAAHGGLLREPDLGAVVLLDSHHRLFDLIGVGHGLVPELEQMLFDYFNKTCAVRVLVVFQVVRR